VRRKDNRSDLEIRINYGCVIALPLLEHWNYLDQEIGFPYKLPMPFSGAYILMIINQLVLKTKF
jgi:hypothetical protein